MCVPWALNPQLFALLTQCSTTEPQEHQYSYIRIGLQTSNQLALKCLRTSFDYSNMVDDLCISAHETATGRALLSLQHYNIHFKRIFTSSVTFRLISISVELDFSKWCMSVSLSLCVSTSSQWNLTPSKFLVCVNGCLNTIVFLWLSGRALC